MFFVKKKLSFSKLHPIHYIIFSFNATNFSSPLCNKWNLEFPLQHHCLYTTSAITTSAVHTWIWFIIPIHFSGFIISAMMSNLHRVFLWTSIAFIFSRKLLNEVLLTDAIRFYLTFPFLHLTYIVSNVYPKKSNSGFFSKISKPTPSIPALPLLASTLL